MDIPFINVGSFVEVTLRSKWDLTRPLTYGGVVSEKGHKDLNAFFIIRKHVSSYGECVTMCSGVGLVVRDWCYITYTVRCGLCNVHGILYVS